MIYVYEHPRRKVCLDVLKLLRKVGIRSEVEPSLEKPRRFCVAVDEDAAAEAKKAIEDEV